MISLSDLKTVYEFLKDAKSFFSQKGVILDFMEKPEELFDLGLGKGPGGGYSNCLPNNISMNLDLVAWNNSLNDNFLQKIAAEVCGLEDAGWTSSPGTTFEYDSTNYLKLPRDLKPGERLAISLAVSIGFAKSDVYKFVEQLGKLRNKRQRIKIVYVVREGNNTKTKKLEKSGINFYESYYPIYESYLQQSCSGEKAKELLNILKAKGQ